MPAIRRSKLQSRIKPLTHGGLEHQILQIHPLYFKRVSSPHSKGKPTQKSTQTFEGKKEKRQKTKQKAEDKPMEVILYWPPSQTWDMGPDLECGCYPH